MSIKYKFVFPLVLSLYYPLYSFGSWHLIGLIGSKMRIQMKLQSLDSCNEIHGSYYYSKYFHDIGLRGIFNSNSKKLVLSEDSSHARFELQYNPDSNSFAGIWKNNKKQFNASLKTVASYYTVEIPGDNDDMIPKTFPRFCKRVGHYQELNKLLTPGTALPPDIDSFSNNMLLRLKFNSDHQNGESTDNSSTCEIIYLDSNIVMLKTIDIYCGGGASCSHDHCYMNYDLRSGELHRIDISEIFSEESSFADTLRILIAAELKGSTGFGKSEIDGALNNKDLTELCFAPYPHFIDFIFPEGEIGPRISGPLHVSIPMKKVSHFLRKDSALRFLLQE
jgi:hypothetical protein